MPEPVTLSIANDHEIIVEGLTSMLAAFSDRIRIVEMVVGESSRRPADVVLFDVFGTGEVHTGAVKRHLHTGSQVAVFTANLDPWLIDMALAWGVRGYLSKALPAAELADAVVRVAAGEVVVAPSNVPGEPPERVWPGRVHGLTEREAEVLALIVEGFDNAQVAGQLYVSVDAVKSRIRSLYRKLGFTNRVQAAVWGVKHGFDTT